MTPPPLRQLSELLGVEVLDVERWDGPRRTWYLTFASAPRTAYGFRSHHFRNAEVLTERVRLWAGDATRPPLTPKDCRRVLRLLHAHVEMKENDRVR